MMNTVVLATIPSDSHNWNLIFMEKFLKECGYYVRNLGCCTPIGELVSICVAVQPMFVIISTVNGHGCMEGLALAGAFRANPLTADIPLFVGGKIGIRLDDAPSQAAVLCAAGFSDAFFGDDQLARICKVLCGRTGKPSNYDKRQRVESLPVCVRCSPCDASEGLSASTSRRTFSIPRLPIGRKDDNIVCSIKQCNARDPIL